MTMTDKSPDEPVDEVLARLYAFVHLFSEPPCDVLDLNQATDEAVTAMADAQAFLERVTRGAKP